MGGQSAFGAKAGDTFTRITVVTAIVWILLSMLCIKMYNPPMQKAETNSGASAGSGSAADDSGTDDADVPDAEDEEASNILDDALNGINQDGESGDAGQDAINEALGGQFDGNSGVDASETTTPEASGEGPAAEGPEMESGENSSDPMEEATDENAGEGKGEDG